MNDRGAPVEYDEAAEYASWFRCLADATRLRLLHAVARSAGPLTIGELVEVVGVGQSSVSGHVRRLAQAGFVFTERVGTATLVRVNPECLAALPDAAATIMGDDERAVSAAVADPGQGSRG